MENDLDFGNGFTGRWVGWYPDRELNPQYDGIPDEEHSLLLLTCPHGEGGVPVKSAVRDGWTLVTLEPLHLEPSILRTECGCHGFIREGKWVSA